MRPTLYTTVITNGMVISLTALLCLSPLSAKAEDLNGQISALHECYKSQAIRAARGTSTELEPLDDEVIEMILISNEDGKEMLNLLHKVAIAYAISDANGRIELNKKADSLNDEVMSSGMKACNLLIFGD